MLDNCNFRHVVVSRRQISPSIIIQLFRYSLRVNRKINVWCVTFLSMFCESHKGTVCVISIYLGLIVVFIASNLSRP